VVRFGEQDDGGIGYFDAVETHNRYRLDGKSAIVYLITVLMRDRIVCMAVRRLRPARSDDCGVQVRTAWRISYSIPRVTERTKSLEIGLDGK